MTVDIWCNQFNIVAGQIQEEGPYVGVFEGTRQAAGVSVYVVAEPVGVASARLCDEVLDTIARAFGDPEPALTANLLRAAAAGHKQVADWNRIHGGEGVAGVGLSCLAVRGDEAYLAQCGPSLAVAHTGGRFRVAAPTGDDSRRPLGIGDRAAPVFTRFSLAPDDVLLLTFSAADRLVDRGTLLSLVNAPPDEAMPALYVRVRVAEAFGALYVAATPHPFGAGSSPAAASPARSAGGAAPSPSAPRVEPRRPAPAPRSARPTRPLLRVEDGDEEEDDEDLARPPARPARPPWMSGSGRRPALGGLGGGARLPNPRTIVLVAAAVAVLVLIWLVVVPALARQGYDDRYQELLRSADTAIADATHTDDAGRRRTLLNRAEADLGEAKALRPDAAEVSERLTRVGDALATLDGARELTGLTELADLAAAGIAPQSGLELAVKSRVYLLDTASGKVLAFSGRPGEPPEVVFEEGADGGDARAGKAQHLAVVPEAAGRPGAVLVLDANRRLFSLSPGAPPKSVPLAGAASWKSATAIAATVDGLYVLDATGERLWRHAGGAAGYDGEPEAVMSAPGLRAAVDLSVSGTPVIVTRDGKLLRLADGHEDEIKPAALDRALSSPSAPRFSATDGMLYVADRGNRRIVVLDPAGAFKGQLVHRRLTALRALALDDASATIYAVSGQTLVSAPLPR